VLPAALIQATIRFRLLIAAGASVAGVIPSHVAALAAGVTRAMFLSKTKIVLAVLFAVSLIAAEAEPPRRERSPRRARVAEPQPPNREAKPSQGAGKENNDAIAYRGRILGPDGKPVAGANVYYHFITDEEEPLPVRTTTDSQGRLSFTLTPKDVPLSADAITFDPFKSGAVVVKADGLTFAWRAAAGKSGELNLQLSRDDVPLEGRILDLQGKPLAGLRVAALNAAAPDQGDLSPFVKALESGKPFYEARHTHLPNILFNRNSGRPVTALLPATTTDADGRFRLRGFAREQLVDLRVEGPAIATQHLLVLTRARAAGSAQVRTPPGSKDQPRVVVFWNGFDHAMSPGLTVVGTVRDRSSGRAIPRAVVDGFSFPEGTTLVARWRGPATVADDQGRYQLTGLPRGKENGIYIRPPRDQAYLPDAKQVPSSETLAQATVDVALNPGVWVDVTATDKGTGKPVLGYITYGVFPEKGDTEPRFHNPYSNLMSIYTNGTFRFVAVPAKALVVFRAGRDEYPIAREAFTNPRPSNVPSGFEAFATINPKPGDEPVKVAFTLSAERVVKGTLIGPDGQPLIGALAAGLGHDWFNGGLPCSTAEFTAVGLDPARPRLLCFVHVKKKLAGSVVVRGDEKTPVTVKLQPWGTVSGRLLDGNGKPIKNASLAFIPVPIGKPDQPRPLDTGLHVIFREPDAPLWTDAEGRFRVERLIPGLKYNLALTDGTVDFTPAALLGPEGAMDLTKIKWAGLAFSNLVLRPGETKNLGDVKLQPFPKK
jgi:protocatechuate 3,4-dioxygenase beta subunit